MTLNDGTLAITAGDLNVSNAGTGTYTQNGGILTNTGINIGNTAGSGKTGTFNLIDGTATSTGGVFVGNENGTTGVVQIGNTTGATPILTVTGGNFEASSGGTGQVTMDSGELNVNSNNLIVNQGGDGTFTLNDGTVDLQNDLRFNGGTGLFTHAGGTVDVGRTLDIGNSAGGDGTYRMTGGILNVGDRDSSDPPGNNANQQPRGNIEIGAFNDASTSALMEIIDGTVNVSRSIRIADEGANSSGTLIIGDGTSNPTVNLNVAVGTQPGRGGNFETADNGTGEFTLKSGTVTLNQSNFIVSQGATSKSTVTIEGGVLNVGNFVGAANQDINFNSGDGQMTHTGGEVNVERNLNLGTQNLSTNTAIYTLDGGRS